MGNVDYFLYMKWVVMHMYVYTCAGFICDNNGWYADVKA